MRRTWPQRLLIVFNSFAIIAALAAAGLVAYGKKTVSDIVRVQISGPGVQPVADLEPGAPQNFLIVGVDDDTGLPADDPIRLGRDNGSVTGKRSDVIMVVRVDPQAREAKILSIPRDLWVDLPGGGSSKINGAFQYGENNGAGNLITTLKQNFGIDINHYVQVNFAAFKGIVSQIDGVQVYLSNPVRDFYSGLIQPVAGCVTLNPDQALSYVRSRHLEYEVDGRWKGDPTVDFGRISRQQDLIRRVIRRAFDQGATNPATLRRMIETGLKTIKIDESTTAEDLLTLGQTFRNYNPDELISYSLPVIEAKHGGQTALALLSSEAQPIIDLFKGTGSAGGTADDAAPSSVTLRVLNGTGKQNQGTDTSNALRAQGFNVRSPGNDTSTTYDRTEVHYRAEQLAGAVLVARYLAANPVLVPDDTSEELTVITGNDLSGISPTPRPADEIVAPTTTTTTTAPTTSTTVPAGGSSSSVQPSATVPRSDPGIKAQEPRGYLPGVPPEGTSCG